jgi:hypothetical protein
VLHAAVDPWEHVSKTFNQFLDIQNGFKFFFSPQVDGRDMSQQDVRVAGPIFLLEEVGKGWAGAQRGTGYVFIYQFGGFHQIVLLRRREFLLLKQQN